MSQRRIVAQSVCHLWKGMQRRETDRVSQVLLGSTVTVFSAGQERGWVRVQSDDTYRGWVEARFLAEGVPPSALVGLPFAEVRTKPDAAAPLVARLSILSQLTAQSPTNGWCAVTLPGGESGWLPAGALAPLPRKMPQTWAREFLGTPYLWGGSSAFGLDCSGLVQLCYRLVGVTLRRDADIQRSDPRFFPVERAQLQPGDLVFFGKPDKITHVGMHYQDNVFIHSAGGAGVILTEWGDSRYSPGYVDARRLDPTKKSLPIERYEAENR